MKGEVPAAPFIALLKERLEQMEPLGQGQKELAHDLGMSVRNIARLFGCKNITFNTADRIVITTLGPNGWWTEEELRKIYCPEEAA